jgi:hypothetical protein
MNDITTHKSQKALFQLQHRLFTPQYGEPLDCSQTATNQVINTLRIVETAINEAIKAGSESIKLAYINIPDLDRNPDGMLGGVRVVGYRTEQVSDPAMIEIEHDDV